MKIVADENLYEPIITYLKEIGNDILSISEKHPGITDDEVYTIACDEKRVIITMDKDFSRISRYPPEKCGGIIVFKIYKLSIDDTLEIFKRYFDSIQERDIINNLVIMSPEKLRIRRTQS